METPPIAERNVVKNSSKKESELGIERVHDVERAYYMASIENLAHAQADAYEDYLKKPEAPLAIHRYEFGLLKGYGLSPADLIKAGERNAESSGKVFDIDKKTQELSERKNRVGLMTQAVIGGIKVAVYTLKFSCEIPSVLSQAALKKDPNIFWTYNYSHDTLEKAGVGMYQLCAALERLYKINKKEGQRIIIDDVCDLEEIKEKAEAYTIPKIGFHEESSRQYSETAKESSRTGQSKTSESRSETTSELSDKISDKIYEWLESQYVEYLKTGKAPVGFSDIFGTFKSKNLKPEDIKQESKHVKTWLSSLSQWRRKFDTLVDENKIKEEQGLNFLDFIFRLLSKNENLSGTDRARSIITPLIKMFLAGKKLKDITVQAV